MRAMCGGEGEDAESECVITLLGNKNYSPTSEREYTRAVATLSAMDFAEENKCLYFEVGALGGQNGRDPKPEFWVLAGIFQ